MADKAGFLELSIGEDRSVLATMSERWRKEGGISKDYTWTKTQKVPVSTLDDLVSLYGLPKFCKIDVEGFEQQVLKGLSQPIPYLSFEFHKSFLDDAKACMAHLALLGKPEFNGCFGESMEFIFPTWASASELLLKIEQSTDKDLWGDIYVKYNLEYNV